MDITYDPTKNARNIAERGLSFDLVERCDWSNPLITADDRKDYGEQRYSAIVPLDGRLHVIIFTKRDGDMRVISFRKANKREVKYYGKET